MDVVRHHGRLRGGRLTGWTQQSDFHHHNGAKNRDFYHHVGLHLHEESRMVFRRVQVFHNLGLFHPTILNAAWNDQLLEPAPCPPRRGAEANERVQFGQQKSVDL